jgi:hypothetical protein
MLISLTSWFFRTNKQGLQTATPAAAVIGDKKSFTQISRKPLQS